MEAAPTPPPALSYHNMHIQFLVLGYLVRLCMVFVSQVVVMEQKKIMSLNMFQNRALSSVASVCQ